MSSVMLPSHIDMWTFLLYQIPPVLKKEKVVYLNTHSLETVVAVDCCETRQEPQSFPFNLVDLAKAL